MRRLGYFLILILFHVVPVFAQDSNCTFELDRVSMLLMQAQSLVDTGDVQQALSLISDAKSSLAIQEAACVNFAPVTMGDKRSNPVSFGQRKSFVNDNVQASIQITQFIDNANDLSRDPVEAGKRTVAVEFKYYCEGTPDQECETSRFNYKLVGDKSEIYLSTKLANSDFPGLFGGGESSYVVGFVVDDTDSNFIFIVSAEDDVYFSLAE